jgi:NADH-quinone oxidoreductase subunit J
MTLNLILFLILAFVAVVSALGLLISRNAIYAALYLIINFATVAVFYLLLGGAFIAVAQIAVYAGAIMVLFLFVIMLLGAERLGTSTSLPRQRTAAIALAAVLAAEVIFLLFTRGGTMVQSSLPDGFGGPVKVAEVLFNQYLLPFEVTSVLLLVAMIGAIVLTKRRKFRRPMDTQF